MKTLNVTPDMVTMSIESASASCSRTETQTSESSLRAESSAERGFRDPSCQGLTHHRALQIDYNRDIPTDTLMPALPLGKIVSSDTTGITYESGVRRLPSGGYRFGDGVIITEAGTIDPRSNPQQPARSDRRGPQAIYSYLGGPWGLACQSCHRRKRRCSGYPCCTTCTDSRIMCEPRFASMLTDRRRARGLHTQHCRSSSSQTGMTDMRGLAQLSVSRPSSAFRVALSDDAQNSELGRAGPRMTDGDTS